MEKLSMEYIAGMMDADGSFSISLSDRRYKGNAVCIGVALNLRQLTKYKHVLEDVQYTLGAGRIYAHVYNMSTWQTTKVQEAIDVAKVMLPHLRVKKEICRNFISALEAWNDPKYRFKGNARKGKLTRPKELIEKMLDTAMNLNAGQQTKAAYDNKKARVLALKERIIKFYS